MSAKKLSVSFDADLADTVRRAAADQGVSVSTWLAEAAAAKARRRLLREALDEFAQTHGPLDETAIDEQIAAARRHSKISGKAVDAA
jgi:hypothetical protein